MSWRIEHSDPLTLLGELPDKWAQTCITTTPLPHAQERTLAVLAEVYRVLRDDGTLWLLAPDAALARALPRQGWIPRALPGWAGPLASGPRASRVVLFTKQSSPFLEPHDWQQRRATRTLADLTSWAGVRCRQGAPANHSLLRRCVLAASSPMACGACGAPYARVRGDANRDASRRATCSHHHPRGRCLVLDPFYRPDTETATLAHNLDRSFLGVTSR
jgi:hypothetical protein